MISLIRLLLISTIVNNVKTACHRYVNDKHQACGKHPLWCVTHTTSEERQPITGVWGQSPQLGPGAEPLVRGSDGEGDFGRDDSTINIVLVEIEVECLWQLGAPIRQQMCFIFRYFQSIQ